jgi:hypothetical protein
MTNSRLQYFGYTPSETRIDWSKLTGDLAQQLTDNENQRKAVLTELDKIESDNNSLVTNTERSKTQNLDELVLGGAQDAKAKMLNWSKALKSGQLTASEYRKRMNNLTEGWKAYANNMKAFDTRMQDVMARQQPGEDGKITGSGFEAAVNEQMAYLGELRGKKLIVNPEDGKVIIGTLNQETGLVDPNSIMDAMAIGNVSNTIDNRVDLLSMTSNITKSFGDYSKSDASGTIKDPRQNEDMMKAKNNFISGVLSSDRMTASILTDNTDDDYDYYFTPEQKQQKLDSMVKDQIQAMNETKKYSSEQIEKKIAEFKKKNKKQADIDKQRLKLESETKSMTQEEINEFTKNAESKLILARLDDNNVYQPILTDQQKEAAREAIDASIMSQVDYSKTVNTPLKSGGGGGGGGVGSSGKASAANVELYRQLQKAINASDESLLNAMVAGKEYTFKIDQATKEITVFKNGIDEMGRKEKITLGRYTDPRDLATYVGFGTGTPGGANSAFDIYEASRIAAEGKPAKGGKVSFNGKVKK